jgi:hypothetical protein
MRLEIAVAAFAALRGKFTVPGVTGPRRDFIEVLPLPANQLFEQ